VFKNPEGVLETIRNAIEQSRATSTPEPPAP
jgi:hypothetical protein